MRHLFILLFLTITPLAFAQPPTKPTPEQEKATAQLNQYFRRLTKEIADKALADVKTLDDWQKQRPELRRQLFEMLGLWPNPERTDLKATVTGTVDAGDFVVEKLHFQSRPRLYVTANFYRPKTVDKPLPTILYACGHGTVKIDGVSYGAKAAYQHHAAWFAQGYCCLILDTLQLGEIEGEHHGTYRNNKWWWISRGYTPAGVEAWNCIRALDYLETRPEVDKAKIGMTGRSGGGAYTWWTTALDDRVACLVPVAGITDLENHVCDGCIEGHCDCMYMINTYQWDFATVAALASPRPLLFSNTDKDNIFPLNGVYRTFAKVKRIYDLHKAGDKLGLLITEGGHKDTQELQFPAFRWFNRWLMNKDEPITRLADKPLDPKQLKVFDKLPEDQLNTTVDEWFVPKAEAPPVPKTLAEWEKMREGYLKELKEKVFRNWPKEPPPLDVKVVAERDVEGLKTQVLEFTSEESVRIRMYLWHGQFEGKAHYKDLLVVNRDSWPSAAAHLAEYFGELVPGYKPEALDRKRCAALANYPAVHAVVVTRLTSPDQRETDERKSIHLRRRHVLLGRTVQDGQVWDALRALAILKARTDLPAEKLSIQASQNGVGVVLCASLFEPAVDKTAALYPSMLSKSTAAFTNVAQFVDVPQLACLLLPRAVNVHHFEAKDWQWAAHVARLYDAINPPLVLTQPLLKSESSAGVVIETELGDVEIDLNPNAAPITVANLLHYVDNGFYDSGSFHRTVTRDNQLDNKVKIAVIQASIKPERTKEELLPIPVERTNKTKLQHLDGTISMARDGPDTATSDFFICIGDQPELNFGGKRNPDGQGFAAFGRVTKGMDVVRKIHQSPAEGQKLSPAVKIIRIRRK